MSIFKCKMCGGTLEIQNNETVAICEYCGTKQTLPRLDDEKRANLYDRANHFRRNNEFDKAAAIYEQILSEDGKDAEAYWSLVLCRYGIEYVEDPATHKRVPTVNRAQFTSIYADADYQAALEHADGYQRTVYEEEAKAIDDIQKGILAISQKEEPFDVFICYKETDDNGRRTPDSVLANDLYHQLTQEGFKVFFARITLEDKLGSAYEPYIFAALNSAKVMVVLGTKSEYFNAVWVKNEWSRFLALTKDGKKTLIPAYKDMDPYYLPPEFASLQAQDMSKLGFMQDLIRGIKKLVEKDDTPKAPSAMPVNPDNPILARAFLFAENRDWAHANEYFEKALDSNPYDGEAYVGKLLVELQISKREELANCAESFENNNNYQMAKRYASPVLLAELDGYTAAIQKRQDDAKKEIVYQNAVKMMAKSKGEEDYLAVAHAFRSIFDYKDSVALAEKCEASATAIRNEGVYLAALVLSRSKNPVKIQEAADKFASISGYKDAGERLEDCRYRLSGMGVAQSTENGGKRKLFVLVSLVACFLILCIVTVFVVMPLLGDHGKGDPVVALPSDVTESTLEPSAPISTYTPVKTATPMPAQTPVRTVTPKPTKTPVKTVAPTATPTKTPVKPAAPTPTLSAVTDSLIVSLSYDANGAVSNGVKDGPDIIPKQESNISTIFDTTINKWTCSMNNHQDFYMVPIGDLYSSMQDKFTLELYVNFEEFPGYGYLGIVDNQEGGGFGFELHNGQVCLSVKIDGVYRELKADVFLNTWYHIIGVWDGRFLKLYMDGTHVAQYDSDWGELIFPSAPEAHHLCIGAACAVGVGGGGGFTGKISVCNLYLDALNDIQVASLYTELSN